MGRKIRGRRVCNWPLIVKSLIETPRMGIAQASVVRESDEALAERVTFTRAHPHRGDRRAATRGPRDLCPRAGNDRAACLPIGIASSAIWGRAHGDRDRKAKHDLEYQQRHGRRGGAAKACRRRSRAHHQHGQAHLRTLDPRRLRPHRFRLRRRARRNFIEPIQSRDRQDRGVRPVGLPRRLKLSRPANRILTPGLRAAARLGWRGDATAVTISRAWRLGDEYDFNFWQKKAEQLMKRRPLPLTH